MTRARSKPRHAVSLVLLFVCLLTGTVTRAAEEPVVREAPRPDSVLFIGNSFTYYNNSLHKYVRELARAVDPKRADDLFFKALTISGARLEDHVLGARGMIQRFEDEKKRGAWDVVVLQGHSREPLGDKRAKAFVSAARKLDAWVREVGARPVLFMTWAYADKPEMTAPLARAYTRLGNELAALVVPVGLAFERARKQRPDAVLHDEDNIHPSLLGSYLAANVFYAALYGKSPVGADYLAGLDPAEAAFAQRIAWDTVSEYYDR